MFKARKLYGRLKCCLAILIAVVGLNGCVNSLTDQEIRQKYTNEASRFMDISGMRVHYRDEGKGDVIVLLHGTSSSLHSWDAWAEQLTSQYRVIRMDLPGFGLTGPHPDSAYEVKDDIEFLDRFLDRLKVMAPVHLAGSSLGGRIAWEYSLHHPDRVVSLTLIDALGYPQESWPPGIQLAQIPVIDSMMSLYVPRFVFEQGLAEIYHRPAMITPELVDRYYEMSLLEGNLKAFTRRVKARLDKDSEQIAGVTHPTLILWGEEDIYFPVESGYRFAADIQSSELITYANVGHLPMEEIPEQSRRDFELFLKSIRTKEQEAFRPSVQSIE